jgi:hypothetical protein
MTTLAIGIAIGLAVGIILMMLSIPQRNTAEDQDFNEKETIDYRTDEEAFIDIDYGNMPVSDRPEDDDGVYGLKRKLARFKLKNRFYN